ncbi:MAG: mechanosensitive ion channel [Gemmatimonadetes bacterium]|nr:mechanosensitive ion channel [Gemmatimonadota bacterium]MCC6771757.1 mechanosensitive ion channel [Gemmatimonadaceae bacterium]
MQSDAIPTSLQSVSEVGAWFANHRSQLVAVVALLVAGVVLALLLRALAVRIVRALERAIPGVAFRTSLGGLSRERRVADVVGTVVLWAVLLVFIAAAADALGLSLLRGAVASLSLFVPKVLGAALIVVAGLVLGNVARGAVTAAAAPGTTFARTLGRLIRLSIIIAAALIAVAKLGVDITLLTAMLSVGLAALLGGFALAFGLGARTAISNIIGSHYLRQTFAVGQSVRIGDIEGTITALTSTSVILQVPDGTMIVPAKQFGEMPSTLLVKGDAP